ncbi:hypothetical protein [Ornithinimicrobium kibberense]|uniref:hypothetical protein n=1 Tax=Ornithinimicrobium kibberense TaxID=282060 RepID=UPI00361DF04A
MATNHSLRHSAKRQTARPSTANHAHHSTATSWPTVSSTVGETAATATRAASVVATGSTR